MSWHWPPVSRKRRGLPKASTLTWILLLNPPRLRPSAWAFWLPFFGVLRRHRRGHGRWCYRGSGSPGRGHEQSAGASVPRCLSRTSRRTFCTPCSNRHRFLAAAATGSRCGPSREQLQQSNGTLPECLRRPQSRNVRNGGFSSTDRGVVLPVSYLQIR
jgi:hypothetical protein